MTLKSNKTIFVNARFLTQDITGVQRFAIEICRQLKKISPEIVFLTPKKIKHHDLAKELNAKSIGVFSGHLWEQIELQSYVFLKRGLLLSLCNTAPLFLKNQIITIHDLCFMVHPEWFKKRFSSFYNFLIPRIARNAIRIITVSKASKKEIETMTGIEEERISVVYNAVAPVFVEADGEVSDFTKQLAQRKYILTVSSWHPRKNFNRLCKAFSELSQKDLYLYVVGNINVNFTHEEIDQNLSEMIVTLNNVNDIDLRELYKNASFFVYPSVYEGFGIPIIEAMSLGCRVLVSDIPVFREISGKAGVYFDPYSVSDIREKMEVELGNPDGKKYNNCILQRYDWAKGAEIINGLLKQYNGGPEA